jgi:hypothetical protein
MCASTGRLIDDVIQTDASPIQAIPVGRWYLPAAK